MSVIIFINSLNSSSRISSVKKIKDFLFFNLLPKLLFFLFYCILSTLRVKTVNREGEEELARTNTPIIAASWHGDFMLWPYLYRWKSQYNNLVSPSKDGEVIANFLELWGLKTIRGSSYKQPRKALYAMKKCLEEGEVVFSIADGSRGPYRELQQGTVLLARMSGSPLVFAAVDYSHKYVVPSWDKFKIPFPFSRAVVTYSDPIYLDKDLKKEALQQKIAELQEEFRNISQKTSDLV